VQLDDRSPNAKPDKLPVAITAFEHLIGSPSCHDFSFGFMFSDQQIGGSPDGLPVGGLIAPKIPHPVNPWPRL
jgi:hypothetical protein